MTSTTAVLRSFVVVLAAGLYFAACGDDDDAEDGGDAAAEDGGDEDTDSDTDADAGDDSGTGLPADCTGLEDFTLCSIVTDPDRSYDICVDEACVSPGCGDATCNAPSPHFPIADTGQRSCCDEFNEIACPSPGEDFFGQDAQYGWDTGHSPGDRFTRNVSVASNPIVTDNVTGLVWQGCAAGYTGEFCETGDEISHFTWGEALVHCDALEWGGFYDWRLPDPYELVSLIDAHITTVMFDELIDEAAFPRAAYCGGSSEWGSYWASSSSPANADWASVISFCYGNMMWSDKESYPLPVLCVRSGPFEARHFEVSVLSDDRIVEDTHTALMWQGCASGQSGELCTGEGLSLSWRDALSYCEDLSCGDFSDWRLPNEDELLSIIDGRAANPAVDPVIFPSPSTSNNDFWTSTSAASLDFMGNEACMVSFDGGGFQPMVKNSVTYVRCVRGGP